MGVLFLLRNILSGNIGFGGIIAYILSTLAVIFITLPVHEYAHGKAAVKLGDDTPRYQGRLTLNPLAHIDYLGAACILLFGFGWAKPVQVNQRNFRNPKRDMALTALAGPVSNIILATISLILYNLVYVLSYNVSALDSLGNISLYVAMFFAYIAQINIYLAVFNLIPIPPLDGSRLLSALLPYKYYYALMRYERYIFWGLLALIWFGILDIPLSYLSNAIMSGVSFIAELPFKLVQLFINFNF